MKKAFKLLDNLSIRTKLNAGFSFIIISMLAVIIVSFSTISDSLISKESKSMYESMKQMKNVLVVYLAELEKLAMSVSRDDELSLLVQKLDSSNEEIQASKFNTEIKQILNKYMITRDDIASIIVTTPSGNKATIYGNQTIGDVNLNKHRIISDFIISDQHSISYDTYVEEIDTIRADSSKVIVIAKKMYSSTSLKSTGSVFLFIKESAVANLFNNIKLDHDSRYIIMGSNSNIVYNAFSRGESGSFISDIPKTKYSITDNFYQTARSSKEGTHTQKDTLITFSTIDSIAGTNFGWHLISMTSVSNIVSTIRNESLKVVWLSILFLVVGIIISLLITKSIVARINKLVKEMDKARTGNLNLDIIAFKNDEIGYLAKSFYNMVDSIKNLIISIRNASDIASSSSQGLSATCEESYACSEEISFMADGVQFLMSNLVSEVATEKNNLASITQITTTATENLNSIASIITEFEELSTVNNSAVSTLSNMSEKIRNAITTISATINGLSQASSEIIKITNKICEMSSETKLLAINAAIESSRIDTKSSNCTNINSFNVVASEIHKLSDKFKISASDINAIIKNIVLKINDSEQSVKELKFIMNETDASIFNVKNNLEQNNVCLGKTVNLNTDLREFIIEIKKISDNITESIKTIEASSSEVFENINTIVKSHNDQVSISRLLVNESDKLYSLSDELISTIKFFEI